MSAIIPNDALSTSLGGTQVWMAGQTAPLPLLFVSDTQINAILPNGFSNNLSIASPIWVTTGSTSSEYYSEFGLQAVPTLFTSSGFGYGQLAALNRDGTVNSPENPAARGSFVSLFGTGGGITSPIIGSGQVVTQAATLADTGSYAVIGLQLTEILYIGSAPAR